MSDYLKGIVDTKINIKKKEIENLKGTGNLPVLHKYGAKLSPLQEMIVKAIYLAGGMFLADIKKLFCFSSDLQKTERAIGQLMTDGYLISRQTQYGKLFGLTKEGISQLRSSVCDSDMEFPTASDMKLDIESTLLKHKIISSFIADYVFQKQLSLLWNQFYTTDKLTRNLYLCEQYVKNIVYRDYLRLSAEKRKTFLLEISVPEQEADRISKVKQYSISNATLFTEYYISSHTFDSIRETGEYRDYIAYIRKNALTKPNEATFYLLKEILPKQPEYRELILLTEWNCNICKYGMENIWTYFSEELKTNQLFKYEMLLEQCNAYIKYLGDEKRSLISTNAYRHQTDTTALKEISDKLTLLEQALEKFYLQKELLETDFNFPVLKAYDEDGADYEEKVITFRRLQQNSAYVEWSGTTEITVYLIQQQEDFFDPFLLHKKAAMSYQLLRRLFPLYTIKIQILTHTESQKDFVSEKLPSICKKMLASRETAFLGNTPENFSVCAMRSALTERYVFFHTLYQVLKGDYENESK